MDKEDILVKFKTLIYKIILPIYLWSIGFKNLEDYIKAIEYENNNTIIYPILQSQHINLNEQQKDTLKKIKQLAKTSHYIDLRFRDDGKYKIEQADFLRQLLKKL